jgi:hypothetical protein
MSVDLDNAFQNTNTRVRYGFQSRPDLPATSLPFQGELVSEGFADTPTAITSPGLRPGGAAPEVYPGNRAIGGPWVIVPRSGDVTATLAQIQQAATVTDLAPEPTGAFKIDLSTNEATDQRYAITFEVIRDDNQGPQLIFGAWIDTLTITVAEAALVGFSMTLNASGFTYWGHPVASTVIPETSAEVYVSGSPHPEKRLPTNRPGASGDLTVELLSLDGGTGVWTARAALGVGEIATVDVTSGATTIEVTGGAFDPARPLFVGDYVALGGTAGAAGTFKVTNVVVNGTTDRFTVEAPAPAFTDTVKAFRYFPSNAAEATFEVRPGLTPAGRVRWVEIVDSTTGLPIGDPQVLRTVFSTGVEVFPGAAVDGFFDLTGTVDVTVATNALTGTATAFLTELAVGGVFYDGSREYIVTAIADDTNATLLTNHASGLTGATAQTRRQWTSLVRRPEFPAGWSASPPWSEIRSAFLIGDTEDDLEIVDIQDLTLTINAGRPPGTLVGTHLPPQVQATSRSITIGATATYRKDTELQAILLSQDRPVAVLIQARSGSPIVAPVPTGETPYAGREHLLEFLAPNVRNLDQPRKTTPDAGAAVFSINVSAGATEADPDLLITLEDDDATLPSDVLS